MFARKVSSFPILAIKKAFFPDVWLFWKPKKNPHSDKYNLRAYMLRASLSISSFAINGHWSRGCALLASLGLDTRILFLFFLHLLECRRTAYILAIGKLCLSSVKVLKYIKWNVKMCWIVLFGMPPNTLNEDRRKYLIDINKLELLATGEME